MLDYLALSDAELIVLMKNGNNQAYATIYDRYKNVMFRHAYRKTGDREEAQDVLQEVFISLWHKKEQVSETENLAGYLYTGMRNRILNLISHKKVRTRYEESLLHFSQTSHTITDHLVREKQFSALIEKEIAALPPKMKEIFLLSRNKHLKNKEIAEMLDVSEHTVATQIKRALKVLRSRLGLLGYFVFLLFYYKHP